VFGLRDCCTPRGVEDRRNVKHVEEEYGEVQKGKKYRPLVSYREEEKRHGGKSRAPVFVGAMVSDCPINDPLLWSITIKRTLIIRF
jgi:hypothetical protein